MDLSIVSDKENKLLGRREIEFTLVQDGATPSKKQVNEELCKKLSLNPEHVIIVGVEQSTGVRQSRGFAHAYASKELLERSEPVYLVNRIKGIKGKAAAAAAPKEEKKVEKKEEKAEKPKEEAAAEKK